MSGRRITVAEGASRLAEVAADRVTAAAAQAVGRGGAFSWVLSGGSTPLELYRRLAAPPWRSRIDWSRVEVFFGDERCVPADHPDSNYGQARAALLDHVPLRPERVHPMDGARPPERAAASYDELLRTGAVEGEPRFDLVLLGIGDDGHTASLFPGTAALDERERWAVANRVPRLAAWRLTLTYPALASSRCVLFLVSGDKKAPVVAEAFGERPHDEPHPCELVSSAHGRVEILADRAAASLLD